MQRPTTSETTMPPPSKSAFEDVAFCMNYRNRLFHLHPNLGSSSKTLLYVTSVELHHCMPGALVDWTWMVAAHC